MSKVIKEVYQPKIDKTVLIYDDGTICHKECVVPMQKVGRNPSGKKDYQKYRCRICRSSFTNLDEPLGDVVPHATIMPTSDKFERLAEIQRLKEQGKNYTEIARILNENYQALVARCKRYGI